jgi:hypothetical protein
VTEDEMQELQNAIVDSIQDYFDNYDWDKAFAKYLEGK